jgi:hypothetical protein
MAIIDNTIAGQMPTFDPATPLKQAAQLQAAEQEAKQAQFKQAQLELGTEARGLAAVQNSPEFPKLWAEASDRMLQKGLLTPQTHQQWRNTPSPLLLKQMIAQTEDPTLSFRKQEAVREQGNQDRSFGLQKTTADRNYGLASRAADRADEGPVEQTNQRIEAAKVAGLDPATPQGRTFALTGKIPEADTSFATSIEQRKQAAIANGLDPSSPGFQSYVLTGKMPREDAQPLTATDKKAILEADEAVLTNRAAIDSLTRSLKLSETAFEGFGAGTRGYAASFLGKDSDLGKGGIATENLTNEVMSNALGQLKAIFGGAPTEGERQVLMDIQGSVKKTHEVRKEIYERAMGLAQNRLEFNKKRADELRGGQFYKPQGSMSRAPVAQTQGISEAEYAKLPSGSRFIAPDGTERVKP